MLPLNVMGIPVLVFFLVDFMCLFDWPSLLILSVTVSFWLSYVDVVVWLVCVCSTIIMDLVGVYLCSSSVDISSWCLLMNTTPSLESVPFLLARSGIYWIISIDFL